MRRSCCLAALLLVAGCQAIPDTHRPVQPLPLDGPPLSYREVISRARTLATQATEAFYVDQWADVEKAAVNLEDTARYLPKTADVPAVQKTSLEARSQTLVQESLALREAAKSRDEKKTTEAMQRINLLVRELRPE